LRNNSFFLHIIFEKEITDIQPIEEVTGIDRGIKKLAATSDNKFFNGGQIIHISKRYEKLRSALQSCGSKSAKRHLRNISKKENHFKVDVNHCITKRIISYLTPGSTIVLENLKSLDKLSDFVKSKEQNCINGISFSFSNFLLIKLKLKVSKSNMLTPDTLARNVLNVVTFLVLIENIKLPLNVNIVVSPLTPI